MSGERLSTGSTVVAVGLGVGAVATVVLMVWGAAKANRPVYLCEWAHPTGAVETVLRGNCKRVPKTESGVAWVEISRTEYYR